MSKDLILWKWAQDGRIRPKPEQIAALLHEDRPHPAVEPFQTESVVEALVASIEITFGREGAMEISAGFQCVFVSIPWGDDSAKIARIVGETAARLELHCFDPTSIPTAGQRCANRAADRALARERFEETRLRAESGDSEAQVQLGFAYDFGEGVHKNPRRAFGWYSRAAEAGDRAGLFNLAVCLLRGQGTRADPPRAAAILTRLATEGDEEAMAALAEAHEGNLGLPADLPRALTLYREAASRGSTAARRALRRLGEEPPPAPAIRRP